MNEEEELNFCSSSLLLNNFWNWGRILISHRSFFCRVLPGCSTGMFHPHVNYEPLVRSTVGSHLKTATIYYCTVSNYQSIHNMIRVKRYCSSISAIFPTTNSAKLPFIQCYASLISNYCTSLESLKWSDTGILQYMSVFQCGILVILTL